MANGSTRVAKDNVGKFLLLLLCLFGVSKAIEANNGTAKKKTLSGVHQQQAPTEEQIELKKMAEDYYAAYQQKDVRKLATFWDSTSPYLSEAGRLWEAEFTQGEKIEIKRIVFQSVNISEAKARLRIKMELLKTGGSLSDKLDQLNKTIDWRRENGKWKLWQIISSEAGLARDLIAVSNEAGRQALLSAQPELNSQELVKELLDIVEKQLDQKLPRHNSEEDQILAICLLAERISETTKNLDLRVRAMSYVGTRYQHKNDYQRALKQSLKAMTMAKQSGNKNSLAKLLKETAFNYYNLGEAEQAIPLYQQSLQLYEELGDKSSSANIFYLLSMAQRAKGKHEQALNQGLRALRLHEELGEKDGVARSLNILGNLYFAQKNYPQALAHFQQSLKIMEELQLNGGIAAALHNIAMIYAEQKNYGKAEEYELRSLAQKTKDRNKMGMIPTLDSLGNISLNKGDYERALEYNQQALKLAEELSSRRQIAIVTYNRGRLYHQKGDYEQAILHCEKARHLSEELADLQTLWRALRTLALSRQALSQPDAARQNLNAAIETVEKLYARAAGNVTERQMFFEHLSNCHQDMVKLLLAQKQPESAYAYAQQMKARVLMETLKTGLPDFNLASDSERNRKSSLENRLTELNRQISLANSQPSADATQISQLTEELATARLKYEAYLNELIAAHPEWKTPISKMAPLTPVEAAQLIPDEKTAVFDFVVTAEKTFLFVLTRENNDSTARLIHHELNITRQQLESRVRQFRQLLADRDLNFSPLAVELFNLLLQPASEQLRGKTSLVIIPNGLLWEVPFQTLINREGRFLIQDAAVTYAPSLPALSQMVQTKQTQQVQTGSKKLLALGPSSESGNVQSKSLLSNQTKLSPEVGGYVLKLPTAKTYTGAKASEETFKSEAGNYRVLHFATHGQLDSRFPMYSALQLIPTEKEDGRLEAREILNLKLQAEVAILAACETGRGQTGQGEGLVGLSWSFLLAGCPTVVSSLWKVESSSTADLMLELHRQLNLAKKPSTAEALRQAALKLLKDKKYRHPFYWSGFVTVGSSK